VAGCLLTQPELASNMAALPPGNGTEPTLSPAPAARPVVENLDWRPGGDDVPVFDPPNFSGRMLGDTEARIEWEHSDQHPIDRLFVRQRLFVPVKDRRAGFVWQGWPERPQSSPDGKTDGITLRELRPGGDYVFAIVEVDPDGNLMAQSPLIEVMAGGKAAPKSWLWLLWVGAGVAALAALVAVLLRGSHPANL
jgi:hypothetical protein